MPTQLDAGIGAKHSRHAKAQASMLWCNEARSFARIANDAGATFARSMPRSNEASLQRDARLYTLRRHQAHLEADDSRSTVFPFPKRSINSLRDLRRGASSMVLGGASISCMLGM